MDLLLHCLVPPFNGGGSPATENLNISAEIFLAEEMGGSLD